MGRKITIAEWYAAQRRWPKLPAAPVSAEIEPAQVVAASPCLLTVTATATGDIPAGATFYLELPHGWGKFMGRIYPSRGVAIRGQPSAPAPGMGLLVDVFGPDGEPWHQQAEAINLDRFWLIRVVIPDALPSAATFRIIFGAPPGSPLRAQKWAQRAVFACGLDLGDGVILPADPQPAAEVIGGPPAHLSIHVPATVSAGDQLLADIAARDAAYWNPSPDAHAEIVLTADGDIDPPQSARLADGRATVRCRLRSGVAWLRAWAPDISICGHSAPIAADFLPDGQRIFFGDLHGQVYDSIGAGTHDEYFRWARDVEGLDFCAPANHYGGRCEADHETWRRCVDATNRFNEPGRFVTLVAYEWGGGEGHRNVYFRRDWGHLILPRGLTDPSADRLADLIDMHERACADFFVVPHHPNFCAPVDWSHRDDRRQRLVEICSQWGISADGPAHSVRAALAMGHRLGFVGGSDTHFGTPGRGGHGDGSLCGLTAVIAPELTREAIWDALYARRCYAVFGERMLIDFAVGAEPMGSEIDAAPGDEIWWRREISARTATATPIAAVELIRNGEIIDRRETAGARHVQLTFIDHAPLDEISLCPVETERPFTYYYLRVRTTAGHFGWSSPIWLTVLE